MADCHACGCEFESRERPGFRETCGRCGADRHVCLNCRFYDPHASNACRENQAELVTEKDRSNRCEWFQAGGEGAAGGSGKEGAREKLDALFRKPGEDKEKPQAGPGTKDPRAAADALFKRKS